jgi:4-carboxymuconolactone decarboxylase
MPPSVQVTENLSGIDDVTRSLVRSAAAIAGAAETKLRAVFEEVVDRVERSEMDEVILQSYLFAGFPRALNAARIWRSVSGQQAPAEDRDAELGSSATWVERGEETCRIVYGESYELLRENIRELHPALDSWMITDGYGKVLSRPQLALRTRELCIVAACAASGQQRQLHSHLHGALNSGATAEEVRETLDALDDLVDGENLTRYRGLLTHVLARRHPPVKTETSNVR